jgi:hypothetical protein
MDGRLDGWMDGDGDVWMDGDGFGRRVVHFFSPSLLAFLVKLDGWKVWTKDPAENKTIKLSNLPFCLVVRFVNVVVNRGGDATNPLR